MLPCMNCKKEIEAEDAKVFAEVLVCPDCYKTAWILYNRGKIELNQYLSLLKDMIRTSLTAGTLQLKMKKEDPDVMGSIIDMKEGMASRGPIGGSSAIAGGCKQESTPPNVQTLTALGQQPSKRITPADTK